MRTIQTWKLTFLPWEKLQWKKGKIKKEIHWNTRVWHNYIYIDIYVICFFLCKICAICDITYVILFGLGTKSFAQHLTECKLRTTVNIFTDSVLQMKLTANKIQQKFHNLREAIHFLIKERNNRIHCWRTKGMFQQTKVRWISQFLFQVFLDFATGLSVIRK